jgi:hypothetical protein
LVISVNNGVGITVIIRTCNNRWLCQPAVQAVGFVSDGGLLTFLGQQLRSDRCHRGVILNTLLLSVLRCEVGRDLARERDDDYCQVISTFFTPTSLRLGVGSLPHEAYVRHRIETPFSEA